MACKELQRTLLDGLKVARAAQAAALSASAPGKA
jgi:hypothetical protein